MTLIIHNANQYFVLNNVVNVVNAYRTKIVINYSNESNANNKENDPIRYIELTTHINADVICLQECNFIYFNQYLKASLEKEGYGIVCMCEVDYKNF